MLDGWEACGIAMLPIVSLYRQSYSLLAIPPDKDLIVTIQEVLLSSDYHQFPPINQDHTSRTFIVSKNNFYPIDCYDALPAIYILDTLPASVITYALSIEFIPVIYIFLAR